MNRYLFTLFVGLLAFGGTQDVLAYNTTHQESFTVDGKTVVYVIDYAFGHEKYNLTMPMHAVNTHTTATNTLGYEVRTKDGIQGKGKAVGIVLSKAQLENSIYTTKKGVLTDFRLLVLYTILPGETAEDFSLHVTHLPFSFKGVQDLELNASELRAYTTSKNQSTTTLRTLRTQ